MSVGAEVAVALLLTGGAFAFSAWVRKRAAEQDRADRATQARRASDLQEAYEAVIATHHPAFKRRLKQVAYKDAYGHTQFDKIGREVNYFIDRVLLPAMPEMTEEEAFPFMRRIELLSLMVDYDAPEPKLATAPSDGVGYERYVAASLTAAGFDITFTPASGDQGVDLVADRNGVRWALQCKNYQKPVGNDAVQQIHTGARFYNAARAVVVAPNGYTMAARQLAGSVGVECLHHDDLPGALLGAAGLEQSPAA